jgi:hypothetical protein
VQLVKTAPASESTPGWNPPLYTNQDTLPQHDGESRMKRFRLLKLNQIRREKWLRQLTCAPLRLHAKW